ncbi:hypothetical protein LJR164_002202 [Phenylobacterium sp. LjRoot164]|uniref:hypothetical protein n=1 Tax=unclassified Phenylobacterium TaxID=2640670 RepID=UPI003ECE7D63
MRRIGILALLAATAGLPAAAHAEDDWTISVTPYVWIAFPTGDVALASGRGGSRPTVNPDVQVNFDDIGLSGAFTGSADVRYGKFGVLGDLTYYEVEADKDIAAGPLPDADGKVTISGTKGMIVGYWRAYETDRASVDILGGAHYLGIDADVAVSTPNRQIDFGAKEDLWDPVIGVRGKTMIGEHFGVVGLATAGGFGVSSESLYEVQAYLSYRFSDLITAEAGYRFYSTKWEGDRIDYDASFSGPLIGLTFTF